MVVRQSHGQARPRWKIGYRGRIDEWGGLGKVVNFIIVQIKLRVQQKTLKGVMELLLPLQWVQKQASGNHQIQKARLHCQDNRKITGNDSKIGKERHWSEEIVKTAYSSTGL